MSIAFIDKAVVQFAWFYSLYTITTYLILNTANSSPPLALTWKKTFLSLLHSAPSEAILWKRGVFRNLFMSSLPCNFCLPCFLFLNGCEKLFCRSIGCLYPSNVSCSIPLPSSCWPLHVLTFRWLSFYLFYLDSVFYIYFTDFSKRKGNTIPGGLVSKFFWRLIGRRSLLRY